MHEATPLDDRDPFSWDEVEVERAEQSDINEANWLRDQESDWPRKSEAVW